MSQLITSIKFCTDITVTTGLTKYSKRIDTSQCKDWSLHLDWVVTGSGVVTTSIWFSNVTDSAFPATDDDVNWVNDSSITISGPAGTTSKSIANLVGVNHRWMRLKFVYASGTSAIINGWANGKV
jgi:hypothetical protein